MSHLVPISAARSQLSKLVRHATDDDVVLMNHGRPTTIMISADRYDALLEEIEDLKDRLSVYEREHMAVPFAKVVAELGIADEVPEMFDLAPR